MYRYVQYYKSAYRTDDGDDDDDDDYNNNNPNAIQLHKFCIFTMTYYFILVYLTTFNSALTVRPTMNE